MFSRHVEGAQIKGSSEATFRRKLFQKSNEFLEQIDQACLNGTRQSNKNMCHIQLKAADTPHQPQRKTSEAWYVLRVRNVPRLHLPLPLPEQSHRAHDDARFVQPRVVQSAQKRDQLDRFPETHLVPDDPPGLLAVELPQPFHPGLLVRKQPVVDAPRDAQTPFDNDVRFDFFQGDERPGV